MRKRFTEEQIIGFLRQADAGMAIKELCRQHGFSEASYYLWRSKFGGMDVSDAKRPGLPGCKRLLAIVQRWQTSRRPGPESTLRFAQSSRRQRSRKRPLNVRAKAPARKC